MIKLKKWCDLHSVSYTTGYNWFKQGKLPVKAIQNPDTGTIMVEEDPKTSCKVTDQRTQRSFVLELDLDLNDSKLSGPDQRDILDKINELVDLVADKIGFGVKSKQWIP